MSEGDKPGYDPIEHIAPPPKDILDVVQEGLVQEEVVGDIDDIGRENGDELAKAGLSLGSLTDLQISYLKPLYKFAKTTLTC
ncbi:MAG: hypothetical protein COX81_01600 [Candidatus Magasanikbacteria bacterium CG_4_10_14_0_2_um_filter_37_12]|uniref:Uncharacterized protein n=1 Tax=Candidatus Magasanikbacteria bacterium CG_4_10_14_0_2_um_filter_37_12 TaxID=1974637 RepID=A0A2M7V8J8_9BACT|nr:MAG: hypothetical protein COX81_01600 [Candidatus Magasanikbacteria bacterium CG_4_10_14_0_2_um_filter_37_12]